MANNRITYSTTQVALKDTRRRFTRIIDGAVPSGSVVGSVGAADTEIELLAFPSAWTLPSGQVRIGSEYIYYTAVTGVTLSGCVRGDMGTTAATHSNGDNVEFNGWEIPMGMQTAAISTAFNLEDVFHKGQLAAYENIEGIPDIEVTLERVLDGTKPLWSMTTDPDQTTLKGRTADFQVDCAINIYPDAQDSAVGTHDSVVFCSGNYISAIAYSMPVEGNFTESVTLIGNDKTWLLTTEQVPSGYFYTSDEYDATVVGAGVQRTEDFDLSGSTLPSSLPSDDHLQSAAVSADIGREEIYELGSKRPYYRAVTFPLTVTTTFEMVTSEGDKIEAMSDQSNLSDETIILKTLGGLTINCGTKNKLSSVSYGGADAGGGNGTVTLEYQNSNTLTITHTAE